MHGVVEYVTLRYYKMSLIQWAYGFYYVIMIAAIGVNVKHDPNELVAASLFLSILVSHFSYGAYELLKKNGVQLKGRYSPTSLRTTIAIATDLLLFSALITASVWLHAAIIKKSATSQEPLFIATAVMSAVGNLGCMVLRSNVYRLSRFYSNSPNPNHHGLDEIKLLH